MPHTGKDIYAKYDRFQIDKAADAVRGGLSLRQASKKFGIPRSTISDRVTRKVSGGTNLGRRPAFAIEIEQEIAETAKTAADKGVGLSKSQLLVRAGKLATRMNLKTPFNRTPGNAWWSGFKRRNPGLTLRQPEPLSTNRSRMMNPIVVGRYLIGLKEIITKYNIDATTIWNCDETGINMLHKPTKVCARVGAKNVPGRVGNSRTQVTLLPCINAAGDCMPPMVVVRGKTKRCLAAYEVGDGPTNAIWTYQPKAWMDDVLGVSWFEEVFLTNCGPKRPQLLILDSHHSHETLDILEKAQENNILILALPPHTTHYLCPLDRAVFGPLQRQYNSACSEYMAEDTTNVIDKKSLPKMIKLAYDAAFSRSNVVAGFEATGIYRWNPLQIPVVAFAPSSCSDESGVEYAEKDLMHGDDVHPLQWVVRSVSLDTRGTAEPVQVLPEHAISEETATDSTMEATYQLTAEPADCPSVLSEETSTSGVPTDSTMEVVPSVEAGVIDGEMLLSEDSFITFISSDVLVCPEETSFLSESNMWNSELQSIFNPTPSPTPTVPKLSENKKKYITSHRLLTSEEIISGKQQDKQQKLKAEEQKRQRKENRELKRKLKALQKQK